MSNRCPDAVLLLHGIARTSASMRAMARALEAAGYRVLNLDYRSRHLKCPSDKGTAR